jgi:hypothetical protein
MVAHLAMEEAADRASTLVNEDHVLTALAARGIAVERRQFLDSAAGNGPGNNGAVAATASDQGFLRRFFARRAVK